MIIAFSVMFLGAVATAQDDNPTADEVAVQADGSSPDTETVDVAREVQVDPINSDDRIANRLTQIMEATGWFEAPTVSVDRGVAFLSGQADSQKHQAWAEATAMNTSDVVAVVNRITVAEQPIWNLAPAITSLKDLGREFTGILPLLVIAALITVIFYFLAIIVARLVRRTSRNRIDSQLLLNVIANVAGVLMFILGLYIALRVSGLSRLALTLAGGTSLIGLALGFAFRDIAENYLASILISLNHPFRVGDLVDIEGTVGFVRKVTTRGTILNTVEGNQVQLPNSTVYKGKITNYTATPLSRRDFSVGIGFEDSVTKAQAIIMEVLTQHTAVVSDPAPMVVVESLGSATVNLRAYFWFDQTKHSLFKVSSSIIRLTKQQLMEGKISMPDEARELVFPQGVPVQLFEATKDVRRGVARDAQPPQQRGPTKDISPKRTPCDSVEVSEGEGDLSSEQNEVVRATAHDEIVDGEANLIG